jgi:hypothetical protein
MWEPSRQTPLPIPTQLSLVGKAQTQKLSARTENWASYDKISNDARLRSGEPNPPLFRLSQNNESAGFYHPEGQNILKHHSNRSDETKPIIILKTYSCGVNQELRILKKPEERETSETQEV